MTIEAIDLTKSFGANRAVQGVSFKIARGRVTGLLGANGAGKSTIMRLIAGALTPDQGRAIVAGACVGAARMDALARLGYLPEAAMGFGHLTAHEFLAFMARARGLKGKESARAIACVADLLNLSGRMDQPMRTLSKGWRQRAWLAQAMLHAPPALVLDEPTDGLDPSEKVALRKCLRESAKDKAVLVSTHILEEADGMCDHIIIIARGRVAVDAPRDELVRTFGTLSAAFGQLAS